jgi:hypothetical protein
MAQALRLHGEYGPRFGVCLSDDCYRSVADWAESGVIKIWRASSVSPRQRVGVADRATIEKSLAQNKPRRQTGESSRERPWCTCLVCNGAIDLINEKKSQIAEIH